MKLWRRVGKRADEILEDDLLAPVEDDIDIVGGVVKDEDQDTAARPKVEDERKPVAVLAKHRVYGPDQFTEEDVLEVKRELEREELEREELEREGPGSEDITDHGDHDDDDGGEESCQKKRCSQCQVQPQQKLSS